MRHEDPASLHRPVMLHRVTEILLPALTGPEAADGTPVHVDGTCGMGGHIEAILEACPNAIAIGIDRDTEALELASSRLARFGDRFRPFHATYDEISDVITDAGFSHVNSILLDLGVSSLQLDADDRGFAYRVDAPLDMRMDQTTGPTAADLLNTLSADELTRILREYGEERFAGRIARRIVQARTDQLFTTSARLTQLIDQAIPAASSRTGGHPAKRTFQALRIAVNAELDSLAGALPESLRVLKLRGRAAVLSYHSLEDRMVKRVFTAAATSSAPPGLPVELPEHAPTHQLLTRGAEEPDSQAIAENSRAASARLRAACRIREGNRPQIVSAQTAFPTQRRSKGRHR
ncbi:16S rRNA (cytosine(1402)-N(4))-methyltransferase RsmH [Dermatophilus congolensis]|uniref:16S rRNA (cytosine(1402)-N(4))-methyltransferase RsmH n=1 Tax=Dermatophilus congolensis TaxID=1863 RepID=UPI001AAE28D5|nr:16S rRNA (cytosine(1402)-N(4))-methyltransferase RsmH [Dermatophilus congolensis]MBO3128913.1 16S rRNA (cytosine(1402)-N(4))-methyltransferase RsmH [Dermatophilus congolensis]MBO3132449.1 16S rRNA (cytosine(1402)-N(4))-methyltransferase RsmH [Dermatophilus congolensis]MBO3133390.1 16S rRNA (cytosine(1402)-N(4))-methyltransferase RsmH [Dermatophilus congolensis]MBO3135625.1 16S rRNA (cytosine(1402)-N(4))-methyltransferase RsmH [Dermatophilus congolensis]MBO3137864.1 16S rRNA (cytosine(1402)-